MQGRGVDGRVGCPSSDRLRRMLSGMAKRGTEPLGGAEGGLPPETPGRRRKRRPRSSAFTARSAAWSVRYALAAYVASTFAANGLIAALWFGVGVPIAVPIGTLIVDTAL